MNDREIKKIKQENKRLREENEELKRMIQYLKYELEIANPNIKMNKNDSMNEYNQYENFERVNEEDMSIISFLTRSEKRVKILKSLMQGDKIPSFIGKEIGDSSHHVSKYLASLKERELVICLNEEDKRFRFYRITEKGKKYLKIVENNEF